MTFQLPQGERWIQINDSEKLGSIAYSKNLNLDEVGIVKLSSRSVTIMDEDLDGDFGVPLAIGKSAAGTWIIPTTSNAVFDADFSDVSDSFAENTGSSNPTTTVDSHGAYFNDLWFTSDDTSVLSKSLTGGFFATWTSRISSLTSGKRHFLSVFENKSSLAVTDGNQVKLYNSSYSNTVTLTLPADYEAIYLAYNNSRMAVVTRPATNDVNGSAKLFIWDGASSTASAGYDIGSDAVVSVVPYESSFAVLTRDGQILFFNGGGFRRLATFPFYITEREVSNSTADMAYGSSMVASGDNILINANFSFNGFSKKAEAFMVENPSGIWCYDPRVGLYHRYSPSISQASQYTVTDTNVDLSTDIFTVSTGTVPSTGNPVKYVFATTTLGGLTKGYNYYIIKLTNTTFKLASSKENAHSDIAIDITSKDSGGSNIFYMYDLVDYGATYINSAGVVTSIGDTTTFYQEFLFGGDYDDTSLNSNDSLCINIPNLENRGYLVTPKLYSSSIDDIYQDIYVYHKALDTTDSIIVKAKSIDSVGLPTTTARTILPGVPTWTNSKELYVNGTDFSEAKTYIDANGSESLEMEIISGAGAGQMVQIKEINYDSGTYSFVLAEDVIGASAGLKCHFVVDNWVTLDTITSTSSREQGYSKIPIDKINNKAKWMQFKIELRGWETSLERVIITNTPNKQK